jgi:hypothetical protein
MGREELKSEGRKSQTDGDDLIVVRCERGGEELASRWTGEENVERDFVQLIASLGRTLKASWSCREEAGGVFFFPALLYTTLLDHRTSPVRCLEMEGREATADSSREDFFLSQTSMGTLAGGSIFKTSLSPHAQDNGWNGMVQRTPSTPLSTIRSIIINNK